jgi:hypothetical protein
MSNQWVEHVRKYAKANNITYMCAITEASKTYKKDDKLKSTPKNESKASPKEQPKVNQNLKWELETLESIKKEGGAILDKDPTLKRNNLSKFEEDYNTTRDMMYEDLRSKMMAFCDKTNNYKDSHEKYYEDIDDLFL